MTLVKITVFVIGFFYILEHIVSCSVPTTTCIGIMIIGITVSIIVFIFRLQYISACNSCGRMGYLKQV